MTARLITSVPTPLLLLAALLALVAVIALWKVVATAGLIGLGQWVLITQTGDQGVAVLALAVPALVTTLVVFRLFSRPGSARSRLFGLGSAARVEVSR